MVDRLTSSQQQPIPLNQQPGSLLSPFVALTAFTRGAGPASMRWDIPNDDPPELAGFIADDEIYQGPIRSRTALANDDALVFAEWMEELGASDVLNLTRQIGWDFTTQQSAGASLIFQGGDTTLLETALAYSTFANLGTQTGMEVSAEQSLSPILIQSVTLAGQELQSLDCVQSKTRSLLSPALAYLVHNILSDEVSRRATLGYPSPLSIGRPSTAMIATAENDQQSWTLGYTPERLVVTWFGTDSNQTLDYRFSAGLWHALIQYSTQSIPPAGWEQPAGISQVIVCDPSGLLPTADCPSRVSEIFVTGNEPGAADTLYRKLSINRETGKLATVFTPLELIEEKIFLIVPPKAQSWAQQMELPVPPDTYDAIVVPAIQPDAHITTPAIFSFIRGTVDIIGTASGSGFSSYRLQVGQGLNPQEWFQIGDASQRRAREEVLAQWDTTGLEGLYAMRLIVQRGTQEIETATIQVTVDNTPPTMTILSPQPGEMMSTNVDGEINLQVRPEDNVGISTVRWYINGELAAERSQSPFTVFLPMDAGSHLLMIEVIDLAGNSTRSEDILFQVE
jgi:membrane carboxypeptidase/penicillin-binding protein PbpC